MARTPDRASSPHDHAITGGHHHDATPLAATTAPASQSAAEPSDAPLSRAAIAPHDHATIGRHRHGTDAHGAATMVLVSQPAGDPADGLPARGGWDLPWPLLPVGTHVVACGAESPLRTHEPQPYLPPALTGPLRPPRHRA